MVGVARIEPATPAMSTPATHAKLRFLGVFERRNTRFAQPERDSTTVRVHIEPTDYCALQNNETRCSAIAEIAAFSSDFRAFTAAKMGAQK